MIHGFIEKKGHSFKQPKVFTIKTVVKPEAELIEEVAETVSEDMIEEQPKKRATRKKVETEPEESQE